MSLDRVFRAYQKGGHEAVYAYFDMVEKRQRKEAEKLASGWYYQSGPAYNDGPVPMKRVPRSIRPRCGARTQKGTPCRCIVPYGKKRCKFHGGCSTGPKSEAGKARIAESNRRRAEAARAARENAKEDV